MIFVSGGTEANNMVIASFASEERVNFLAAPVEHPSVLERLQIPLEVFLGAASRLGQAAGAEAVSVAEMAVRRHGPGRILNMKPDAIDAAAVEAARTYGRNGVSFELLGAERRLRAAHKPPEFWLACHYDRIGAAE